MQRPPFENVKAVVFNWDDTLVDMQALVLKAYGEATMELLGEPFPATAADELMVLSMPAADSFGMLSDDPLVVEALLDRYHDLYVRLSPRLARAVPDAGPTLVALRRRGIRTGAVTSKLRSRVAVDEERCGLTGLVDVVVTGDDGVSVPHPEPVRRCLRELGVAPGAAVFVGDAPAAAIAAHESGVAAVGTARSRFPRAKGDGRGPVLVVRSLSELLGVVRAGPAVARG